VPTTELSSAYAAAELAEMVAVLRHLTAVQQVLLRVNAQYISSAAQDDAFRREPPFQLQGSYRNMTKLAEKVVPAMNAEELQRLIDDHYQGEAQTLTSGAEHNLLKLKELRGTLQPEEKERWQEITAAFQRLKRLGGSAEDPAVRAVSQLGDIGACLEGIRQGLRQATESRSEASPGEQALNDTLGKLDETLEKLHQPQLQLTLETPLPPAVSDMLARQVALVESLVTMVYSTTRTLEQGGAAQVQLMAAVNDLKAMGERLQASAEPRGQAPRVVDEAPGGLSRSGTQPGVPVRSANKDKP